MTDLLLQFHLGNSRIRYNSRYLSMYINDIIVITCLCAIRFKVSYFILTLYLCHLKLRKQIPDSVTVW